MSTDHATDPLRRGSQGSRALGMVAIGLLAAFAYLIVLGGTGRGEIDPFLRAFNSAIAGAVILGYVIRGPSRADAIDRAVLLALGFFIAAGLLSAFPRQSLDAVLAATAYAAAFFLAREYLADAHFRIAFVRVFIGLSAMLTIMTALLWMPSFIQWWSLTNWTVVPPLDIHFSGGPWGHRYDLALLIALLYPAWWIGQPSRARRMAAVAFGFVGFGLIVLTGSRTLWGSLAFATAALGLPYVVRLWRRSAHRRLPIIGGVMVAVAGVVLSGVAASVVERAANLASLDFRLSMWGPLTDVWLSHPIAGVGPGAFPWILQLTPYFDTNSFAPRHPDSVLFQLLPEAGLLGVAALAVILLFVAPRIIRGAGSAARWALIAFGIACLGANPTDFAFLVVVLLGWAAYAVPHRQSAALPAVPRWRQPVRYALLASLGIIFVATAATLTGGFGYESARAAIARGALDDGRAALDLAVAVDPGMALYSRQRGTLHHIQGNDALAIADLERAASQNPSDDLARRTLFLARARSGDMALARSALASALDIQRSDPTNMLLASRLALDEGREADAVAMLAEIVQSWPTIVASPGWAELLPASVSTADVVDAATARWQRDAPTPERAFDQGIWLGVMSHQSAMLERALQDSRIEADLGRTMALLIACDVDGGQALDTAPASDRRSSVYSNLRVRESALEGDVDFTAVQALQIMTGGSYTPNNASIETNPLDENAAFSLDRWGYRRNPIQWPSDSSLSLPSIHAGGSLWLFDPRAAVAAAGLGDRIEQC